MYLFQIVSRWQLVFRKAKFEKIQMKASDAHQRSGVSDLIHNSIVAQELQWEPEGKGPQFRHRLAGGQTCGKRLTQRQRRWGQEVLTQSTAFS